MKLRINLRLLALVRAAKINQTYHNAIDGELYGRILEARAEKGLPVYTGQKTFKPAHL
jgi:hypothetical protein